MPSKTFTSSLRYFAIKSEVTISPSVRKSECNQTLVVAPEIKSKMSPRRAEKLSYDLSGVASSAKLEELGKTGKTLATLAMSKN